MKCSIAGCPGEYEQREVVHTIRQGERIIVIDHVEPKSVLSVVMYCLPQRWFASLNPCDILPHHQHVLFLSTISMKQSQHKFEG